MPSATGEVPFKLAGEDRVLRCSLRAYKSVNAMGGGFMGALRRVSECDSDTITSIVCFGLNARTKLEIEKVEEGIYADGVTNFMAPCILYLEHLTNGGRPIAETDGEGSAEGKEKS